MIANGSPFAAETIVVDPGAPRISTSPPISAPIAAVAGGDHDQIDIKTVFLEQAGVLGDPERDAAAGDRSVGDVKRFELLRAREWNRKIASREDQRPQSHSSSKAYYLIFIRDEVPVDNIVAGLLILPAKARRSQSLFLEFRESRNIASGSLR